MEWHQKAAEEVIKELGTGKKGLTQKEASERLKRFGPNVLPEKKKETALHKFLMQFRNVLVIILIIAAVVSAALGELVDASAILLIVILNAFFGFFQERKAERALEALKKMAAPRTHVVRDGKITEVAASDLVVGDAVSLEVGDRIPADCRVIEETNLRVDESVLTGESTPVSKAIDVLKGGKIAVADRKNMLFSGTTIVYGRCRAIVVSTASGTEFGKIAKMLQVKEEQTPLQKKLGVLGKQLGIIILVIAAVVFGVGLWHGFALLEMFLTAVSLAVAAIPEGLPAVMTITLSVGLLRMAKKNAIIRKLPAVETLGSTTTICSDKTGTLTKNQMTVRKLYVNGKTINVTGEGYAARGDFAIDNKEITKDDDIELLLTVGMMCNNANLDDLVGDPTELALLVSAKKFQLGDMRHANKRVKDIEFDSQRKMMSAVYEVRGKYAVYTKGAVEEVLKRCTSIYRNGTIEYLKESDKKKILSANSEFASEALRVLAFATKRVSDVRLADEKDLIFVGLQGMMDTPRHEVRDAITVCRGAGIKVVMITGDHKDTAAAVAKELGLMEKGDKILTGDELDSLKDEEFLRVVESVSVYARVSPEHKVRITDALKKKGQIVAMTGDGVNDAPALKKADIGIAMGIAGTDVAKEASDMVLADDNFASIVSAVEEGRGIYDNIRKFILYLLSCNIGEVLVVFLAIMFVRDPVTGLFVLPLLPVQLLWMNLVTDGIPALALGVEPYGKEIMKRKPRDPKEKVLSRHSTEFVLAVGVIIAAATLYLFYLELPSVSRAQTMAFTSLVVFEMAVALSMRSPEYIFHRALENKKLLIAVLVSVALQFAVVYVPFLRPIFDTVPLSVDDWIRIGVAAFLIFALIEANKIWKIERRITGFFVEHEEDK